jgi:type IV secretory pathway TrbD component
MRMDRVKLPAGMLDNTHYERPQPAVPGDHLIGQVPSRARSGRLALGLLYAAVTLHVAFPKSGFKFGGIPFTIPDIVYAAVLIAAFFRLWRPVRLSPPIKKCIALVLVCVVYFALRIWYERVYGYQAVMTEDVAKLVPLCVYPLTLVAITVLLDSDRKLATLLRFLRWSVVIVLIYGIAQKIFGEYRVVIPGLTADWDDAQEIDFLAGKYNVIDWSSGALKLTSTYQNGNLLGTNLLLTLPLCLTLYRSRGSKAFVLAAGIFAIAMCASRSAWAGAVCLALLALQLNVKRWLHKAGLLVLLGAGLYIFVFHVPVGETRVLEAGDSLKTWGSRLEPAGILWKESVGYSQDDVQSFLFGPSGPAAKRVDMAGGGAYEVFYLAVYWIGGVIGVVLWLAPVVFSWLTFYRARSDPIVRAVFLGTASWGFAAMAEGAYWLPPTAFNLWSMLAIGWLRVQSLRHAQSPVPVRIRQVPHKREVQHAAGLRVSV